MPHPFRLLNRVDMSLLWCRTGQPRNSNPNAMLQKNQGIMCKSLRPRAATYRSVGRAVALRKTRHGEKRFVHGHRTMFCSPCRIGDDRAIGPACLQDQALLAAATPLLSRGEGSTGSVLKDLTDTLVGLGRALDVLLGTNLILDLSGL
jgi:hypothetical protein